jgi:osmotically-inducible protein OsmY
VAPISRLLSLVPGSHHSISDPRRQPSSRVAFAPGSDDSFINAAVKSALQREPDIGHAGIHVSTSRGEVQLSGYVASRVISRAVETARAVPGVRTVRNDMRRR